MALFVPTSCNMTVYKTVSNSTRKWLFLLNFFLYNTPNGKKKVSFCECMCSVVVLNLSDIFFIEELLILQPYQKPIRCAFEFNSQTDNKGELASIVDMGMTMIIKCNQTRVSEDQFLHYYDICSLFSNGLWCNNLFLFKFSYPGDSENYTVPLKIYWDDQDPKQLDNPFNVQGI